MEARIRNATAFATKVNQIIDSGGMVFDEDNNVVYRIVCADNKISVIYSHDGARFTIFNSNPIMDDGLYTPIAEWNSQFKKWRYIDPSNIKQITWGTK